MVGLGFAQRTCPISYAADHDLDVSMKTHKERNKVVGGRLICIFLSRQPGQVLLAALIEHCPACTGKSGELASETDSFTNWPISRLEVGERPARAE